MPRPLPFQSVRTPATRRPVVYHFEMSLPVERFRSPAVRLRRVLSGYDRRDYRRCSTDGRDKGGYHDPDCPSEVFLRVVGYVLSGGKVLQVRLDGGNPLGEATVATIAPSLASAWTGDDHSSPLQVLSFSQILPSAKP